MNDPSHVKKLEGLSLFEPLSISLRKSLADLFTRASDELTLPDAHVLYTVGAPSDGTGAILIEGRMLVTDGAEEGTVVDAPVLLGEMYQFNPRATRTATVVAKGPVRLLEFAWSHFHQLARESLSTADQGRFVQAVEEYAFKRLPETPLLQLPGLGTLPRHTLLRISLAVFWIAQRQTRVEGEVLFAAGTPTRGEGFLILEGKAATLHGGHALEVLRGPVLLGPVARQADEVFWQRTGRVVGHAITLRFSWPEFIAYLETVLTREEVDASLRAISGAVDTRC